MHRGPLAALFALTLAFTACGPLPRGALYRDDRGGVALFTALPRTYGVHPVALARTSDGAYGVVGTSEGPMRFGAHTLQGGGFALRVERDGSVRWARLIVGAETGDNIRPLPRVVAGPEGSLLVAGAFRGSPSAPDDPPSVWPLRLYALQSISAEGSLTWQTPLEFSSATDATGLATATGTELGGLLVLFERPASRVERYSGSNGSLWMGVTLREPGEPRPRAQRMPLLLASTHRQNGIDEDYLLAGELTPGTTLDFDDRPGTYANDARPNGTVPPIGGLFLARIAPYHRTVRWVRALETRPAGITVDRGGVVLWSGATVRRYAMQDGAPLWSRAFGGEGECAPARLQRVAGEPQHGALVAVLSQSDSGRCTYAGHVVETRTNPSPSAALVALRLAPSDGHTEAVALVQSFPAGPASHEGSHVGVADALVEPDGRVVLLGGFSGRLQVDGAQAESSHGTENRCTHEDYTRRSDCARVPYEHGALFLARPAWRTAASR